jgi:hypothetical protein
MDICLNEFQRLRLIYPEWSKLKEFLISEANLRIIESEDNPGLAIIKYVKEKTKMDSEKINVSFFRSVIVNVNTNTVVSYAPPKSEKGLPLLNTKYIQIEKFIDGFMIQAFITSDDTSKLQLATRTSIGGKNDFYSKKSFQQLFEEALSFTNIGSIEEPKTGSMEELKTLMAEQLIARNATAVFASFVVQHPEHRIVTKHEFPYAHMVHFGWSLDDGSIVIQEKSTAWINPLKMLKITECSSEIDTFTDVQQIYMLMNGKTFMNGLYWQGIVFKDGSGRRWKMRSKTYTKIRDLRGPEAKAVDRFLRLRKDKLVSAYLKYYWEESEEFSQYETTLRERTVDLLSAYTCVNKIHNVKFGDLDAGYKPGVYTLHNMYMKDLRPNKKGSINFAHTVAVVNSMKPFEQARLIKAPKFVPPPLAVTA